MSLHTNNFQPDQLLEKADYLFDDLCMLNSFSYRLKYDWLLGAGVSHKLHAENNTFHDLKNFFLANAGKFIFGHLSYDIKNQFENLSSRNSSRAGFSDFYFFVPEMVIYSIKNKIYTAEYDNSLKHHTGIADHLMLNKNRNSSQGKAVEKNAKNVDLKSRIDKKAYLQTCEKILQHIRLGDVYELNYCMELYNDNATIDPVGTYKKLMSLTQAPMSCFYKTDNKYLICASPERFVRKSGNRIIAQPMKGTIRRSVSGIPAEDESLKNELYTSEKERAENIMITDLVRNDLSRIAKKGTVKVNELCGIYSFKTVHQMISTICCELRDGVELPDIIKAIFPVGSMTGAPKIKAMQLIDEYEHAGRGLFAGSVGYIAPDGDFDFNVVIRSILYNAVNNYLSAWAGSAITANSQPEKEYDECMLKLAALKEALE